MKVLEAVIWLGIAFGFLRGLFVLDMGPSAEETFPTASALCLAGSVVAASILFRRSSDGGSR